MGREKEDTEVKVEGEEYFGEEEELDPFAIGPQREEEQRRKSSSAGCVLCGFPRSSGDIPLKGRRKRRKNDEGVVEALCKFLGVEDESEYFSSAPYCPSCEEDVRNIWGTLKKLEELQRELEGMKEEIRRKISLVVGDNKGNKEEEVVGRIRNKIALGLKIHYVAKPEICPEDMVSTHIEQHGEKTEEVEQSFDDVNDDENDKYYDTDSDWTPEDVKITSGSRSTKYSFRARTKKRRLSFSSSDESETDHDTSDADISKETKDYSKGDISISDTSSSGPAKRKRGRPKKTPEVQNAADELKVDDGGLLHPKRKRGRPRKNERRRGRIETRPLVEQCSICSRKFRCLVRLQAHVRKVHEGCKTPYQCDFPDCTKKFGSYEPLVYHQKVSHNPGGRQSLQCQFCGKIFVSEGGMQLHMMNHHIEGGRRFECTVCGRRFATKYVLKKHEYKHNGNWPLKCDICGKGYAQKLHLDVHVKGTHLKTGEYSFGCSDCGKSFRTKLSLQEHQTVVHSKGELAVQCEVCGLNLVSERRLKAHMKIHLPKEERDFGCPYCEMRFYKKTALNYHIKRHKREKSEQCEQCGQGFVEKKDLKLHIEKVHVKGGRGRPSNLKSQLKLVIEPDKI